MSKRKSATPPVPANTPPTPEQVKALADQLSDVEQMRLHQLFVMDPASKVGAIIRTYLEHFYRDRQILERRLGIAPGQMDPDGLLSTQETCKEAAKRLGLKNAKVVKTARTKLRRKIEKATLPPRSLPLQ